MCSRVIWNATDAAKMQNACAARCVTNALSRNTSVLQWLNMPLASCTSMLPNNAVACADEPESRDFVQLGACAGPHSAVPHNRCDKHIRIPWNDTRIEIRRGSTEVLRPIACVAVDCTEMRKLSSSMFRARKSWFSASAVGKHLSQIC